MEGLRPKEVGACCLAGNGAGGLLPPEEDHPSSKERKHGSSCAGAPPEWSRFVPGLPADPFTSSAPPSSDPIHHACRDPAHFPRWVELEVRPHLRTPPLIVIGCLGSVCPPTSKVDWCIESSVGAGKQIIKSAPLPPVLMVKSRGTSLCACHYPTCKAFLKGSSPIPGPVLCRISPPLRAECGRGPDLSYSASHLGADSPAGLLGGGPATQVSEPVTVRGIMSSPKR